MDIDKWILERVDIIKDNGFGELLIKVHNGEVSDIEITIKERPKLDIEN